MAWYGITVPSAGRCIEVSVTVRDVSQTFGLTEAKKGSLQSRRPEGRERVPRAENPTAEEHRMPPRVPRERRRT
jgi:hypothetical protein